MLTFFVEIIKKKSQTKLLNISLWLKLQNGSELHFSQIKKGNQKIMLLDRASYCCRRTTQIVLLRKRECTFFKKQNLQWCFLKNFPNHRIQFKYKVWELYSSLKKTLGTPWNYRWKLRWLPFQGLQLYHRLLQIYQTFQNKQGFS